MDYENEKLIEFNQYLAGRKVAIIGLGVSNLPLIDYLYNLKAKVTIFDQTEINDLVNHGCYSCYSCEIGYFIYCSM